MHPLAEVRLGQELDRAAWGDAYEDHDLVFARENGAPLRPEYATRGFVALSKARGRVRCGCTTSGTAPRR